MGRTGTARGGLRNTVLRGRPTDFYPAVSVSTALLDFPFASHTSRRKLLRWANMSDRPHEFLNVLGFIGHRGFGSIKPFDESALSPALGTARSGEAR